MSTRALYTFIDQYGQYHVYKHHDGYPSGALGFIELATRKAWALPRFEADEFAASFVAANKTSDGGVRLTTGATWKKAASGDIEYHYTVSAQDGKLRVKCDHVAECNGEWVVDTLKDGLFGEVAAWAVSYEG